MAIHAKLDFYVRISEGRHPELFRWLRETAENSGRSLQEITIAALSDQLRKSSAEHSGPAAPPLEPPVARPSAVATPAPAPEPDRPGGSVPRAPFQVRPPAGDEAQPRTGLVGSIMDKGD